MILAGCVSWWLSTILIKLATPPSGSVLALFQPYDSALCDGRQFASEFAIGEFGVECLPLTEEWKKDNRAWSLRGETNYHI
jgi:hypothetical protein